MYLGIPDKLISELKSNVFAAQSGKDFMARFYKKVNIRFGDSFIPTQPFAILVLVKSQS